MHFLVYISWLHGANIEPYITLTDTRFRLATPSRIRLLVFLFHATQGANYHTISVLFGLGRSTVSKCIHDVSKKVILHMWATYIHLPSPQEAVQNMHNWRLQIGIPRIVGAIDGTHIHIQRPCNHGEAYFNRKSFYSLNVQGTSFPIAANLSRFACMGIVGVSAPQ